MALYCTIFELFDVQNIVTLKSRLGLLNVIGNGTIRQIAYVFLFVFHCNYGVVKNCDVRPLSRIILETIQVMAIVTTEYKYEIVCDQMAPFSMTLSDL